MAPYQEDGLWGRYPQSRDEEVDPGNDYSPYRIDWRFLPPQVLVLKDRTRPLRVDLGRRIAIHPLTAPLWHATIGWRTRLALKKAGILFIHIPRTSGTSISSRLYGRNLPHYTAAFYADVFPDLADLPSFAIIRDPFERLKSAYRFIRAGGTAMMATNYYAKALADRAGDFDSFVDILYERFEQAHPFETLERQTTYIQRDGRLAVDHLFTLCSRRRLPRQLYDLIGIRDIPHFNATRPCHQSMSGATLDKINRLYAADIRLFNRIVQNSGVVASVRGRNIDLES